MVQSPGPNLVPNPSFERTDGDLPAQWSVRTYSGPRSGVSHLVEKRHQYVRTGSHSLRISSESGHDTSVYTPVTLKEGFEYRLSGWVKTEGLTGARGAQFNLHEAQAFGRTQAATGDSDWTGLQLRFTATEQTKVTLNALFGGWGRSTGTAWFDDVELVELFPVAAAPGGGELAGDARRGEKIFREHQVAACIRCHSLNGEGGLVGPHLDGIALRKDPDYILESLVDPPAKLAAGFEKIVNTPMPPMNIVLNDQELADIMEFLLTLKQVGQPVKPKAGVIGSFE